MNIFRLLGDLSHLLAIIILLLKIWKTRSCAGECYPSFSCCIYEAFYRVHATMSIDVIIIRHRIRLVLIVDIHTIHRYQRQVADPLCDCLYHSLSRFIYHVHLSVQHIHEDYFHYHIPRYSLLDVRQV